MRWIRLIFGLVQAKFKSKIQATQTTSLSFRVWITDIDVSFMNHAAILTVMEVGRLDYMVRTSFFKIANKNKWFIPSRALTVQYYRPLKFFQKAKLQTRLSYIDEKWVYLEQKIIRNGKDIAACLIKCTIKKGRETVPTSEIIKELGVHEVPRNKSKLIEFFELENEQMNYKLIDQWKN